MLNSWLLDSASTYHVCNDLSALDRVEEIEPINIEFGDNMSLPAMHKGCTTAHVVTVWSKGRGPGMHGTPVA
eukprot:263990-Chlamydomonas_euryale.AAC.1